MACCSEGPGSHVGDEVPEQFGSPGAAPGGGRSPQGLDAREEGATAGHVAGAHADRMEIGVQTDDGNGRADADPHAATGPGIGPGPGAETEQGAQPPSDVLGEDDGGGGGGGEAGKAPGPWGHVTAADEAEAQSELAALVQALAAGLRLRDEGCVPLEAWHGRARGGHAWPDC
jgi:hypothetical protein